VTLIRTGFIPIPPGRKPGFDHADVYPAGRRMYVAHTGAKPGGIRVTLSRSALALLV
jgi:hypothetical protein